jgi:hypothetical protein
VGQKIGSKSSVTHRWANPLHQSSREKDSFAGMVPDYVTIQPRGSVLILTDFAGASFDQAVFDKPFVKKSALIGTKTLPKEFYEQMKIFARRELPIFATREEALAWLVEE